MGTENYFIEILLTQYLALLKLWWSDNEHGKPTNTAKSLTCQHRAGTRDAVGAHARLGPATHPGTGRGLPGGIPKLAASAGSTPQKAMHPHWLQYFWESRISPRERQSGAVPAIDFLAHWPNGNNKHFFPANMKSWKMQGLNIEWNFLLTS